MNGQLISTYGIQTLLTVVFPPSQIIHRLLYHSETIPFSQSFLPSVYTSTGGVCSGCYLLSVKVLSPVTPHSESGAWQRAVSQGSWELLPRTFTTITQHISAELLSPSAFGKSPGRVCVYVSKTGSKHHLQGFKQALKHAAHSAWLGSVGGLPVNLLLRFVLLLIAQGLRFPFRSPQKPFCYFFLNILPESWLTDPCIIVPVVFRIPYL